MLLIERCASVLRGYMAGYFNLQKINTFMSPKGEWKY